MRRPMLKHIWNNMPTVCLYSAPTISVTNKERKPKNISAKSKNITETQNNRRNFSPSQTITVKTNSPAVWFSQAVRFS